ncbi:MAG: polysaccharide deacetylase family protein [Gammaproteobacteria bacterium]|nr:polysaccharide deacetylase family protein [Gammaproteobacteria bacterium]
MSAPRIPPRWHPSPLLFASAGVHGGAVAAVLAQAQLWPWALGALAANHVLLAGAGLSPRSRWLGSNWTRLPSAGAAGAARVALTLDDGPDPEVTPRVLEMLAARGARATFFCIGERVAAHAALAREILAQGHTIENHSQRHLHHFSLLGPRRLRAEIERAQETIGDATGSAPRFFRAPAGLRSPLLDPLLQRLGLQLASWTRRGFDTVEHRPQRVLAALVRNLTAGDILLLHDGHAARTEAGTPVVLDVLPRLLGAFAAAGLSPVTLREALGT